MADSLLYKLRSGKPPKFIYYMTNYLRLVIPSFFYRRRQKKVMDRVSNHLDSEYILWRVNYYNRLLPDTPLPEGSYYRDEFRYVIYRGTIGDYKISLFRKAYFFDSREYTRWFNPSLRWGYCPGDVYFTPEFPSIVKSRLLSDNNQNSILLNLDKFRHFMFVNDNKPFAEKKDMAIFRGKIRKSRDRKRFMELFIDHPMFDCGIVGDNEGFPEEWMTPKKTIREHLDYKFIMALEGNDVASNLKWVMSSNSIAVMPRPTCETWFMEGELIPDLHYIEVKPDFSDIEEKLTYYCAHPKEAERIIWNAHNYVEQFRDPEREDLISLVVLEKYFEYTGQKP